MSLILLGHTFSTKGMRAPNSFSWELGYWGPILCPCVQRARRGSLNQLIQIFNQLIQIFSPKVSPSVSFLVPLDRKTHPRMADPVIRLIHRKILSPRKKCLLVVTRSLLVVTRKCHKPSKHKGSNSAPNTQFPTKGIGYTRRATLLIFCPCL